MNRRGFLVALGGVVGWTVLAGCRLPDLAGGPEGLADPARRRVADAVISSFENSTVELPYAEVHELGDGRGITAGRAGFTSGTHDLLLVVQRYEAAAGGAPTPLTPYLPALTAIDAKVRAGGDGSDTGGLEGFEEAWATASRTDPRLNAVQDDVFDELYFVPALEQARGVSVTTGLGQLILLDSAVQHGTERDPDGLPTMVAETDSVQGLSSADGEREVWLSEFLEVRRAHLLDPADDATAEVWRRSVPRVDTLAALLAEERFDLETPIAWTFAGQRFEVVS